MAKHIRIFAPVMPQTDWRGRTVEQDRYLWPVDVLLPQFLLTAQAGQWNDGVTGNIGVSVPLPTIHTPGPFAQLVGVNTIVTERTAGGLWLHGDEVGQGKLMPKTPVVRVYKAKASPSSYYSADVSLKIAGAQRYGSTVTRHFAVPFIGPGESQQRYIIYEVRVINLWPHGKRKGGARQSTINDLHEVDWEVPSDVQVLRDLVLSSPDLGLEIVTAGRFCCGVCRRYIESDALRFTVNADGRNRFYAICYPEQPYFEPNQPGDDADRLAYRVRVNSNMRQHYEMMVEQSNTVMVEVGQTCMVHPECIGLTLDW